MSDVAQQILATLGEPAAWLFAVVIVLAGLSWIYGKINTGIAERERALTDSQRVHQHAIEATFAMYQAQLSEYRGQLETAKSEISYLRGLVDELRAEIAQLRTEALSSSGDKK